MAFSIKNLPTFQFGRFENILFLTRRQKMAAGIPGCQICNLLLHDLQDLHGTGLHANAASDALGSGTFGGHDHDLHGADLHAFAAGGAQLLVDHVHTCLGILGNGTGFTSLHALTTLDAGHGLCTGILSNDLNAGQIFIKLFKEGCRASTDTLQTSHTFHILFDRKLFHKNSNPLF